MTLEAKKNLFELVEKLVKMQEQGEITRSINIQAFATPEVFLVGSKTVNDLPEGKVVYKAVESEKYPWEASVVKNGIKYYVLLDAEDCWNLYVA